MNEIAIRFHAIKGSKHILQAPAHSASILTTGDHPGPLKVVGVYLNGAPLTFRSLDAMTVAVSPPILAEGGRVELRCVAPKGTSKAPQSQPATHPSTNHEYGLQRPIDRNGRHA